MRIRIELILLFFFWLASLAAQNTDLVKVSGTILDSTHIPIEFAQIVFYQKDTLPQESLHLKTTIEGKATGKVMASDFSDNKGQFSTLIAKGNYMLLISQVGKTLYTLDLKLDKDLNLGTIQVENIHQLNEIIVQANPTKLIERKADRLVFNVDQIISISGGTALDALRITPRIKVSNDQISMVGKNTISVMIDEKLLILTREELIEQLKSIRAEDIKSIEVIANPSAKYMAEGNSGLINIVTKKQARNSWDASVRIANQQATYATQSVGLNLGLQKERISFVSSFSFSHGSYRPILHNYIYYSDLFWKEETRRKDSSTIFSSRNAFEYHISEKLAMGLQISYITNHPTQFDNIQSSIQAYGSSLEDSLITTNALNHKDKSSKALNYHLTYNPSKMTIVSLDIDMLKYQNISTNAYTKYSYIGTSLVDNSYSAAENKGSQKINNIAFNADVKHDFTRFDINYGGRFSFIKTFNRITFYDLTLQEPVEDPDQSNRFEFLEKTQALFISFHKKWNDKWDLTSGLRLENTQTVGYSSTLDQINKSHYSKLFPTVNLNYTLSNHVVSLNLGRRIGRPSFNYLNPFRWVYSPYSYSEGNPFLQPSFTYNLEVEHTYNDFLTTTLYFSKLENGFEPVTILNDLSNRKQTIPQNFLLSYEVGLDEYISLEPFDWWTSIVSLAMYYSSTQSKIPQTLSYLSGWNGEFSISNDFVVNTKKNLFFNISYNYTTRGVDNLDRNSAFSQLDASVKILFAKKKLQLTIYGNDILKTNQPEYSTQSNGLTNINQNYYDTRYLRLAVSYNFGQKTTTLKERNKNSEEVDRLLK